MGDSANIDGTSTIVWQVGGPLAPLAEGQAMALRQQHELLEDAQQRMAAWVKRRQVALETGIDALTRMAACKTPVETATICSDWVSGSFTRILADLDDVQAHTVKMAEHFQKSSSALLRSSQAALAESAQPVVTGGPPVQQQLREAA